MNPLHLLVLCFVLSCTIREVPKSEPKLVLSGRKLTQVPDSVFEKTDLVYLDLGASEIVISPPLSALINDSTNLISVIPNSIGKLVKLKVLILNSNKLTNLPDSITSLQELEVLDLSINPSLNIIRELGKLKQLQNLKTLIFIDAQVSRSDLPVIQAALPKVRICTSIEEYFEIIKEIYH